MLAPIFYRHKLHIGAIESEYLDSSNNDCWLIPVEVRASYFWKSVIADIQVRATIGYSNKSGHEKFVFATWVTKKLDDTIVLGIHEIEQQLIIAIASGAQLLPLRGETGELFQDNQDIKLQLTTGKSVLGTWCFPKAIVNSVMQKVKPVKVK